MYDREVLFCTVQGIMILPVENSTGSWDADGSNHMFQGGLNLKAAMDRKKIFEYSIEGA